MNPADPSTQFSGNYTLFMVDADIPGTDIQGTGGVNRHWLVNGVTIGAGTILLSSPVNPPSRV